ncbi:MAG: hypothetical protein AAFX05_00160, partial [Planctomycetota bacterium]
MAKTKKKTKPARAPLPAWKKTLFIGASVLLPIVAIGAVEMMLRLFGLGGHPATFRTVANTPDGGSVVLTQNDGPASFFFRNRRLPGNLHATGFRMPRPEGTVRVMLCGASAIKGFPQNRAWAPSAFLEVMLEDAWGRDVEVINLGVTAIASFPVSEILAEAVAYEPDLIVIYAGHNEFFGAYGVGSLVKAGNSPGVIRAQRRARSLALFQVVDNLLVGQGPEPEKGRTLMELMIGETYVAPDDPLRDAAAGNLEAFIGDMIDTCDRSGVPVMVCTLPINERGLAPIGTSLVPSSVDAARFDRHHAL